jgi:leader peptidase (prepilin peptidase)/N-methyltransferase
MHTFRIAMLIVFGIPLTIFDLRWRRLPNLLTASFAATGLLVSTDHAVAFMMMAMCAVVFGAISVTGIGFGMGDSKLIVGIAAWSLDWRELLACLQWSFALAGLFAVVAVVLRKLRMRDSLPLGPFLLLGTLVALVT